MGREVITMDLRCSDSENSKIVSVQDLIDHFNKRLEDEYGVFDTKVTDKDIRVTHVFGKKDVTFACKILAEPTRSCKDNDVCLMLAEWERQKDIPKDIKLREIIGTGTKEEIESFKSLFEIYSDQTDPRKIQKNREKEEFDFVKYWCKKKLNRVLPTKFKFKLN